MTEKHEFNILSQKNGRFKEILGVSGASRDPQEGASGGAKASKTTALAEHRRPRAGEARRIHINYIIYKGAMMGNF